jgi:hypothetical protein
MRVLHVLLALLALFAAPVASAVAEEWGHYVNERFGVEADVPPGFAPGQPPVNGDGLGFSTPTAELRIYGSFLVDTDFEGQVKKEIGWRRDDGWAVSYEAVTPGWASYSGKRGNRIFYVRAIRMCGGDIIGEFDFEYPASDVVKYDPVVERLVRSLRDSGKGWQC